MIARRARYDQGDSDAELAAADGVPNNTIRVWRRSYRLPPNDPQATGPLTLTQTAARMLLYQLGWGDNHISRELERTRCSVREWRARKGLRANFASSITERNNPRPTMRDVTARVRRAIGRGLPRDIADDAAGDLMMAVLDGTIPIQEIEKVARKFGNKALGQFANKFGPRSLDEEIGDEAGFKMLDLIRDDSHSSWLEEMGATVW